MGWVGKGRGDFQETSQISVKMYKFDSLSPDPNLLDLMICYFFSFFIFLGTKVFVLFTS